MEILEEKFNELKELMRAEVLEEIENSDAFLSRVAESSNKAVRNMDVDISILDDFYICITPYVDDFDTKKESLRDIVMRTLFDVGPVAVVDYDYCARVSHSLKELADIIDSKVVGARKT